MKIVNAHCHLIEVDKALGDSAEGQMDLLTSIPSLEKARDILPLMTPDEILRQMDEAGIANTILFACISPMLYASNEFVASICKKYPERFTGFASVNPHDPDALTDLEFAVKKLGLKGLKFHPPLQNFYPNDKMMWPIYDLANRLNIPVVFHVGTTPFGRLARLDQAYPVLLDDVAIQFPDLKIILTHLGTLWHNETFMVAEKNPNVFIDTAAYPHEITELLNKKTITRVGEDKFIFGTDFPMPYEGKFHEMKDFVQCVKDLAISDNQKNKIFHDNIANIISL